MFCGLPHAKKRTLCKASSSIPAFCHILTYSENSISILIFPKATQKFYIIIICNCPLQFWLLRHFAENTYQRRNKHPYFSTFHYMSYNMRSTYLLIALKRWGDAWPGQILLKFIEGFLPTSIGFAAKPV